jgi:hypothetical protein
MDIAAERIFGLWRGATSGHIRMDLYVRSDKATDQKDLSPEGFAGPFLAKQQYPEFFNGLLGRKQMWRPHARPAYIAREIYEPR